MNGFLTVPIDSVIGLTPERAVAAIRSILRAECRYAGLSPAVLTISGRISISDGGIDADVTVPDGTNVPRDCLFTSGLTGFQIKSGASFKPWTDSAIRGELLNGKSVLFDEVQRLVNRVGRYTLICTGHDLTTEQRNDSREKIVEILTQMGGDPL